LSYLVLARKWRPKAFGELVGQEHVVRAISNALDSGRVHHAFLFTGTRGVGKTTIARLLAKALNCDNGVSAQPCGGCSACREIDEGRFVDLIEVDAASRTKVEDTRELLENVQYAPSRGRYKVYLIDEVHMLSGHSFNAFLKTLEEPPPHVKFLLATTDPQKLPITVVSRCLQFHLKRLPIGQITDRLSHILAAEGVPTEPSALPLIARAADGSLRDALSLLDQALVFGGGRVGEADVRSMLGTIDRTHVARLVESVAAGDAPAMLETIHSLDDQAPDYDQVLVELSSLLQRIALEQVVPGSATESGHDPDVVARLAAQLAADEIQLYYQMAIMGRRDLGLAPDPRTGFEMTMLRLLAFRPVTPGSEPTRTAAPPTSTPVSTGRTSPTPKPMPSATGTKSAEVGGSALAAGLPLSAEAWIEVAAALGLTGGAQQLAANCTWSGVSGSTLLLRLHAGKAGLHTAQMEERVQSALQQRFGATTRLVIEHSAGGEAMPADTLAQREADEQAERLAQAHAELILDPNVADLTRRFGAKVVADTVKPNH
jgi:DNA polymerase-3 subunit gamma/tau